MINYLIFQLYGPLASWGEIAVGELRHSAFYPSKSALIGLIGAALGIERTQEVEQIDLMNSFHFFIKLISPGYCLQDYHTTQAEPPLKKRAYHSRREVFTTYGKDVNAILSTREYRADALSIIAIAQRDVTKYSLELVREAMLKPKFHLYLGRKSCPLALPLNPVLLTGDGPRKVLDNYTEKFKNCLHQINPSVKYIELLRNHKNQDTYYWEDEASDLDADYVVTRYDQPISRKRWQFAPRQEHKMFHKEK